MQAQNAISSPISRSQLLFNLAYSMIPLIGFWLVEKYWGLTAGIIAAIALAIVEVLWVYIGERRWEKFSIWSAILVIIMGLISWKTKSTVAIRLKPGIFEGIFAILFIGSSLVHKPFMLVMAKKQFKELEFNEIQLRYFNGINWRIGILFLIHTAITIYAAIWLSEDAWIFVKGVLFYILFLLYFVGEIVYSRWVVRPKMALYLLQQRAFLESQRDMIRNVRRGKC